jgi:hypothetical protein
MSTLRNERENRKRNRPEQAEQPDNEVKLHPGQQLDPELQEKLSKQRQNSNDGRLSASVKKEVVIDHENQHSAQKVANPITIKAQQDAIKFAQISGAQDVQAVEVKEESDFENKKTAENQNMPSWTKNSPSPKPEAKNKQEEENQKSSIPSPFIIPECRQD